MTDLALQQESERTDHKPCQPQKRRAEAEKRKPTLRKKEEIPDQLDYKHRMEETVMMKKRKNNLADQTG